MGNLRLILWICLWFVKVCLMLRCAVSVSLSWFRIESLKRFAWMARSHHPFSPVSLSIFNLFASFFFLMTSKDTEFLIFLITWTFSFNSKMLGMILWPLKYDALVSDFFIQHIALAYRPPTFPSIFISDLSCLELTEAPRFAVGIGQGPANFS